MGCYHVPCQLGFRVSSLVAPGLDGENVRILGFPDRPHPASRERRFTGRS